MTRRERMLRIIEWMGPSRRKWALEGLFIKHGLDLLTDEAIDKFARQLVLDLRFSNKLNKQNREMIAAKARVRA